MFENLRIAVVGATGVVGEVMLDLLSTYGHPAEQVVAMASAKSAGKTVPYGKEKVLTVFEAGAGAFDDVDVAFVSATDEVSRDLIPKIVEQGCVVIDDSAVWRMDSTVPLVIPEVNGETVEKHQGVLAIPNCSTTIMVMALWPLHRVSPIKRVVVSTYQAVSGTGAAAVEELKRQSATILAGRETLVNVYPHQIAFNLLPHIGSFEDDGSTSEEVKMVRETRKIMAIPDLVVSATCVRVPILVSHSEAVYVEFEEPMSPDEARKLLAAFPGVTVVDDPARSLYPMPIDATGKDDVFVGRIRADVSNKNGLVMWVVSDNLRKGAATNAI